MKLPPVVPTFPGPRELSAFRERVLIPRRSTGKCWMWLGTKSRPHPAPLTDDGHYGVAKINGRHWRAHRLAHELFIGPIPDGFDVDHLCCRPLCVNPAHLEAVAPAENRRRAISAGRYHRTVQAETLSTAIGLMTGIWRSAERRSKMQRPKDPQRWRPLATGSVEALDLKRKQNNV